MHDDLDRTIRERLARQQLSRRRFAAAVDVVRWFGAVQAQDYDGALWAVGQRMADATVEDVERAVADRSIVRTWPMRGTLHFVPADDARWMLAFLARRTEGGRASRHRALGLDARSFARAGRILQRALEGRPPLTRAEAYAALAAGGVSPEGQRGIHLVAELAVDGLLAYGPRRERQPTLVLLDEWIPGGVRLDRHAAIEELARRYARSHAPCTPADFAWWTRLPLSEAREVLPEAAPVELPPPTKGAAALLPAWDEYLVAYKDRGAALGHLAGARDVRYAIGVPLVLQGGRVAGTWRRSVRAGEVAVAVDPWMDLDARTVAAEARRYARFLGRELVRSRSPAVRRSDPR